MSLGFEEIKRVIIALEDKKNQALCESKELEDKLKRVEDEICRMQATNDELIGELECSDQTAKEINEDNSRLKDAVEQKERELADLQEVSENINRLESDICSLEREMGSVLKETCEMEEQITELDRCIKEKDGYLCRRENKAPELEDKIRESQNTINCFKKESKSLRQDINNWQSEYDKVSQHLECLCSKQKDCECATQKLKDQVQCMETNLDHADHALHTEKDCVCRLKALIQTCLEENQKFKTDHSYLQQENCELKEALPIYHTNMMRCQRKYEQAHTECEQLKRTIEQFKNQIVAKLKCNLEPDCNVISRNYSRSRTVNNHGRIRQSSKYSRARTVNYGKARRPTREGC